MTTTTTSVEESGAVNARLVTVMASPALLARTADWISLTS
jgi:hypothetical protein